MNESYWMADCYSVFVSVVYCPGCKRVRAEEEMVDGKPRCIHCSN